MRNDQCSLSNLINFDHYPQLNRKYGILLGFVEMTNADSRAKLTLDHPQQKLFKILKPGLSGIGAVPSSMWTSVTPTFTLNME